MYVAEPSFQEVGFLQFFESGYAVALVRDDPAEFIKVLDGPVQILGFASAAIETQRRPTCKEQALPCRTPVLFSAMDFQKGMD